MHTPSSSPTLPCPAITPTYSSSVTHSSHSTPPTPPPTPPNPPPLPTLSHLPEDLLRRVIFHLFAPSYRATPYYPPSTPHHVLPLSETCRSIRSAVSKHLVTDQLWLQVTPPPADNDQLSRLRQRVLAWYRFAGVNLTSLNIVTSTLPLQSLRADVLATVAGYRPKLRTLHLTGITANSDEQVVSNLREILFACRSTLTQLALDLAAGRVVDVVCEANMSSVKTLQIRHGADSDALRLLPLLHSLKNRATGQSCVEKLVLRTAEPLPEELVPAAVAAAAPNVKEVEYCEMSPFEESGVSSVLGMMRAWENVREVVIKDGRVSEQVAELGEGFRCLERVGFVNCWLGDGWYNGGIAKILRRLEISNEIGLEELNGLRGCSMVEELGVKVKREALHGLENVVASMGNLWSLGLSVSPGSAGVDLEKRERNRAEIMRVLETGKGVNKLVLQGESLGVKDLELLFKRGGWEYLVTGIWGPGRSRCLCIVELLRIVREWCRGIKVLCFGLELEYDARVEEVGKVLEWEIEETGRVCEGLDMVWLKRNLASLRCIQRPDGWRDGWIEGFEDVEDDEDEEEVVA